MVTGYDRQIILSRKSYFPALALPRSGPGRAGTDLNEVAAAGEAADDGGADVNGGDGGDGSSMRRRRRRNITRARFSPGNNMRGR
jgi:hypothetical protein